MSILSFGEVPFSLKETCMSCGVVRENDHVFHPCECSRIYDPATEATIRIEFDNFKIVAKRLTDALQLNDIGWLMDLIANMNPHTRRMLSGAFKNSRLNASINKLVSDVRTVTPDAYQKNHKDMSLYWRIQHMTPDIAKTIRVTSCMYYENPHVPCNIAIQVFGLCYKHIMMFYIAHTELSEALSAGIVKICLHYLLEGYEHVAGCIPVLTHEKKRKRRN